MKKIFLSIVAVLASVSAYAAEKVSFTVDAPMIVSLGQPFRVSFNINAKPDNGTFQAPSFENFDVMAGPSTSQSSSTSVVNGKATSSVSYGYTYVVSPQKEGTFTIGAASVSVGGSKHTSNTTVIEVRGESQSSSNSATTIAKDDLMLRLELSKTSAYKGEPIRATLKLCTRVNFAVQEYPKMPAFNGFWSQQLDVNQGPFRETINNKAYDVYNVAEYILYPQQSGELTIEPIEMTAVALVQVESSRNYDPFFGSPYETLQIPRKLKTPELKVKVKEFPAGAPASFLGAVGRYTMSHELSATELPANSSATLQITISGVGNLNFVSAPTLSLPASFELYDIKSEERLQNTASGSRGYRRFDYPFIVRAEGEYDVAPVEFTYFDLEKQKYETLSTGPLKIVVTPDLGASAQSQTGTTTPTVITTPTVKREDVKQLGEDIRYIKQSTELRSVVAPLVLSSTYWIVIFVLLLAAIATYLILRKRIRDNSDEVLVKGRRANRVAVKRFRVAAKYMREDNSSAFYKEMLSGLWGYMSDRFNIPIADLKREVVREELQKRGAAEEAETFIAVIARCEEAQYSPIANSEMESIYDEGVEAVSKIEKVAK